MERLPPTRPRCTLKRFWLSETPSTVSLRKEVIQPQVLRVAILPLVASSFSQITSRRAGGDREAAPGPSVPNSAGSAADALSLPFTGLSQMCRIEVSGRTPTETHPKETSRPHNEPW